MDYSRDDRIKEQVQSLIKNDKNLGDYGINVDVFEGEVQLQGIVDTLSEKEHADELVRRVKGIRGVDNAISISTDGTIRDRDAVMEVSEELRLDPRVDANRIGVESVGGHGIVILKGQAKDHAEVKAAKEAAAKARGVTKVLSQVKIGNDARKLTPEQIFHSQVRNDGDSQEREHRL